jgi:DHA1 family tetracycline resistance protein-like MFS transporter
MLGAAFGIGFIIGPALGGLLGGIDLRLPFWIAAALSGLNFLYGLLVLPESLPIERRRPFELRSASPLGSLRLLRRYPQVGGLVMANVVSQLAHYALPAVFVLYAGYRYGWGEDRVGYVLALVGVCNVLVQAVLMRRFIARFGERRCLIAGLLLGGVGFAVQGLATSGPLSLLAIPFLALWGLAGPSSQALITRQIAADEQGRLQGALTSAVSLTGVFGPAMFASVFAAAIAVGAGIQLPGAPFLLAAALLLLAAGIAWRTTRVVWQPASA